MVTNRSRAYPKWERFKVDEDLAVFDFEGTLSRDVSEPRSVASRSRLRRLYISKKNIL